MDEKKSGLVRKHAYISGVVQGVGFRWFVERVGKRRQLAGWVRNLPDGCVELEVEGPEEKVRDFLDEVGRGPVSSRVESVTTSERLTEGAVGFHIRF